MQFCVEEQEEEVKKETTSHEGKEFPVLSEVSFGIWRHLEATETRHTTDTCYFF